MTDWLEVSLTVNGEQAEAVAEVLARFAPNGVMTEQGVKYLDDEDEGTVTGPVSVRAYLPVDHQIEETRRQLEEALYYLGMIQPLPPPVFTSVADQNWMEAWKVNYKPILIGSRLVVVPAWLDSPEPGRLSIKIDPGMAFGTGTHPTTQLCLELIEKSFVDLAEPGGLKVIDVGCGSGILSIAALKLGAVTVLALDIDPGSGKNSRENADLNGIGNELIIGIGSVGEILEGRFAFRKARLVVSNILAPVIIRLFDSGLADLLEPDGVLILSGILQDQAQSVLDAAQVKGMVMKEKRQMGDWIALALAGPRKSR